MGGLNHTLSLRSNLGCYTRLGQMTTNSSRLTAKFLFFGMSVACLLPLFRLQIIPDAIVAPAALIGGMVLGIVFGSPFPSEAKRYSKILLQSAVVLLGFSLNIGDVLKAGQQGLVFSLFSILAVFGLGFLLQKLLNVRKITSLLVSTGTAICGGSAIAAMSAVVDAPQEDVTVAVGTVFLLNAVGLVLFPILGHVIGLNGQQFGTWAGIAIHDVSSVVGAATSFGQDSLPVATAVKLSRVLYLVPATLIGAALVRSKGAKAQFPWFVLFFIIASALRTAIPGASVVTPFAKIIATSGFALSLFLIGSGLTKKTLKAVGAKPLIEGVLLWLFISIISLFVAKAV